MNSRFPSAVWSFSAQSGWNFVHQQLANMPPFRSLRAAKSSNVSSVSALITRSAMRATYSAPAPESTNDEGPHSRMFTRVGPFDWR